MSFVTPNQAIPYAIYSNKVVFKAERNLDNTPIASIYSILIKLDTDSVYDEYIFSSDVETVTIDPLIPASLYDVKWKLTNSSSVSHESSVYQFRSQPIQRFSLPPSIPVPTSGEDFTGALQEKLDLPINYLNTLDDETAIERLNKEGVGRLYDFSTGLYGCTLNKNVDGTILYLDNGYFQSGAGFSEDDNTLDSYWFPGAKLFRINKADGYWLLPNDQMPPNVGTFYGYMGAYLNEDGEVVFDIIWENAYLNTRPNARWYIGSVVMNAGTIDSVDVSLADRITYLKQISSTGGGGGNVATGGGSILYYYIQDTNTNISYNSTTESWKEVKNFNVAIESDEALIHVIINSVCKFTNASSVDKTDIRYRVILDYGTDSVVIRPLTFNGGSIYFEGIEKGTHNIRIDFIAFENGTLKLTTGDANYQVTEFESKINPIDIPDDGKDLSFDLNSSTPAESVYDAVYRIRDEVLASLEDRLSSLDTNQTTSLTFLIKNMYRGLIGLGFVSPASLLRIDGAFVIPEKYGQSGVDIVTESGDTVGSPIFEGPGNLTYDSGAEEWIV